MVKISVKKLQTGVAIAHRMSFPPLVIDIEGLATRRLRVKRPSEYQKGLRIFGIVDARTNDLLVIQMHQMRLLWIDARTVRIRDEDGCALKHMDAVCRRLSKAVRDKYPTVFRDLSYVDPFRNDAMSFCNLNWSDVYCMSRTSENLDWRRVQKTEMIDVFVYPKNIWTNAVNYGISFRLVQIRRCEPLGCKCFSSSGNDSSPPPPPPPLPPPGIFKANVSKVIATVSKADQISSENYLSKNHSNSSSSIQVRVPSLEEILKSRQKLRITNLLSE